MWRINLIFDSLTILEDGYYYRIKYKSNYNEAYKPIHILFETILNLTLLKGFSEFKKEDSFIVSSSVLEYKMTKCTSKWTTFFILTYIPNYIQNDL